MDGCKMNIAAIILLILHVGFTIIAGNVFWRSRSDRLHALADWLIIAFFPFGGIWVVWILELHRPDRLEEVPDPAREAAMEADLLDSKINAVDVQSEINIAPLLDMLLVADFDRRRQAILDILKTDTLINTGYMQTALHNEDTETVHYAASGLQHIWHKLDARLHELHSQYLFNPENPQAAAAYADLLDQYLTSFKLDPATRQQYLQESIKILSQLVENSDLTRISRLIDHLMAVGEYQQAGQFCRKLFTEYPESETKYLVLLKNFFLMKDKSHFDRVFDQFRTSDISFSRDTLNIIRLWIGAFK
jgi:hypothetical protein